MGVLYTFGIYFYQFLILLASVGNKKAKKRYRGAKEKIQIWPKKNTKRVWFHCASLGEFEMVRPLIEHYKNNRNFEILITFFSPSGYDIRKNYPLADKVLYLPFDTAYSAKKFLEKTQPDIAFFVKYEFWLNFIKFSKKNDIKIYSIASVFREKQRFFKPWGRIFMNALHRFDHLFVQDEASKALLFKHGLLNASVIGDPRVDRVVQNAKHVDSYDDIATFCHGNRVFICGSTWSEDEEILLPFINKHQVKTVIAPHEINEKHINNIEKQLGVSYQKYSEWDKEKTDFQVLIIDNIGMLANIYQYGSIAYIGGAFKTGLHNILEPAAFGLPVIFGPKITKFPEANQFIQNGFGQSVSNTSELENAYDSFQKQQLKPVIENYLNLNTGASQKVIDFIGL